MKIFMISLLLNLGILFFKLPQKDIQNFKLTNSNKISVKISMGGQSSLAGTRAKKVEEKIEETSKNEEIKKEKKIPEKVNKKGKKKVKKHLEKKTKKEQFSQPKKENQKISEKEINSENNVNSIGNQMASNIFQNSDGGLIASSADGIEFTILRAVDPEYPIMAERVRYKKIVIVKAKFLVGYNGEIENIEILNGMEKFGFNKSVEKALQSWRFRPILYKNKPLKVYFTKEFKFKNKF